MQAITTAPFWDNEADVTHPKGATLTRTPARIAYLYYSGLADTVTGTTEEQAAFDFELGRLQGGGNAVAAPTYAAMRAMATGNQKLDFLVLSDESKGETHTFYTYWPDRCILWHAAVVDVTL